MPVTIDKFEYATDEAAQAVWLTSSGIDEYVKVLLHFNGSNGSQVFTDSSPSPHTFSAVGNAQISTAQSKFGGSSYLGDGNGDYITCPYDAALDIGTGDFTIDFWIYMPNSSTASMLIGASASSKMWLGINWSGNGKIEIANHGTTPFVVTNDHGIPSQTWTHVAIVRSGTTVYYFRNGTLIGTPVTSSLSLNHGTFCVCGFPGVNSFNGYLNEFRYSVGIARWTSSFTVPSSQYQTLGDLQIYSEGTIKQSGNYSVKIIAALTTSLNQTVTRTVSPTINLTDQDNIKIWVRASRTGTNFKIGLHDSGGTTTESNIAISEADTWEEKTIDISAVANANKDAIDSIILTITNADAENTIYLDEMLGYVTGEGTGGGSPRYGDRTGGK